MIDSEALHQIGILSYKEKCIMPSSIVFKNCDLNDGTQNAMVTIYISIIHKETSYIDIERQSIITRYVTQFKFCPIDIENISILSNFIQEINQDNAPNKTTFIKDGIQCHEKSPLYFAGITSFQNVSLTDTRVHYKNCLLHIPLSLTTDNTIVIPKGDRINIKIHPDNPLIVRINWKGCKLMMSVKLNIQYELEVK